MENKIRPFSESISTGNLGDSAVTNQFAAPIPEPVKIQAAFETLRKVYRGDVKLPSQKAVIASKKLLEQWKKELLISKKGNPDIYRRIEAALKVKHPGEIMKPGAKVAGKITATQKAKAEKIVSEVGKQLGQKKLAKATITRIAGKIAPFLGVFLTTWAVIDLAKNKNIQELYKKLLTSEPGYMAESTSSPKNISPQGENYHKDVGWY